METIRILTGQGIGDSVWSLFKVRSIARRHGAKKIQMRVACWNPENEIETRSQEFLSRFSFIDSCEMHVMPRDGLHRGPILRPEFADEKGRFIYLDDGPRDGSEGYDFVAIPNGHLERGGRLEKWLPEYKMEWDAVDHFVHQPGEESYGRALRKGGKYAIVYFGPRLGNSSERSGHNRGQIWKGHHWCTVIEGLLSMGLRVVAVGASYDRQYYEEEIPPSYRSLIIDLIGQCGIGWTMSVLKRAAVCISYQSGIGILSSYLGVPTCIFWRSDGDSIYPPPTFVSFDERMASAWTMPDMIEGGKHFPAIYGKHWPEDVLKFCGRFVTREHGL